MPGRACLTTAARRNQRSVLAGCRAMPRAWSAAAEPSCAPTHPNRAQRPANGGALLVLPQPPPLVHALQRAAPICNAGIRLLRLLPRMLYLLPLPLQVGQDGRARGLPGKKMMGHCAAGSHALQPAPQAAAAL